MIEKVAKMNLQQFNDMFKIFGKTLGKQLWEDQLIWGRAMVHTDEDGTVTRVIPFSDEWEEAVAKIKENE